MTGFESFVGVNPWTALFTFCNMLITFAVLRKFLFKPVKKMIDDRQQEIDTMYADADAAKQKAADLEKQSTRIICRALRMSATRCCVRRPPAPRSVRKRSSAKPRPRLGVHPRCGRGRHCPGTQEGCQ